MDLFAFLCRLFCFDRLRLCRQSSARPTSEEGITRSSSLPQLATDASAMMALQGFPSLISPCMSTEGVQEVGSSHQAALAACLAYKKSNVSIRTNGNANPRVLVRSHSYAGPFCIKDDDAQLNLARPGCHLHATPSMPLKPINASRKIFHPQALNKASQTREEPMLEYVSHCDIPIDSMCQLTVSSQSSTRDMNGLHLLPSTRSISITEDSPFESTMTTESMVDPLGCSMEQPITFGAVQLEPLDRFRKVSGQILRNVSARRKLQQQQSSQQPPTPTDASPWSYYHPSMSDQSKGEVIKSRSRQLGTLLHSWSIKVHKLCHKLVTWPWFEYFVLLVVIASSISLVSVTPAMQSCFSCAGACNGNCLIVCCDHIAYSTPDLTCSAPNRAASVVNWGHLLFHLVTAL